MLVDTHAHIHQDDFRSDLVAVLDRAKAAGVNQMLAVGVSQADSIAAVDFAHNYDHIYATIGLHPHDAESDDKTKAIATLSQLADDPKVVAVGECGLDYSRDSGRAEQEAMFRAQIKLAVAKDLPMVWHVREAFDDFFEIVDSYQGLRGVVHCFTADETTLNKALDRGFFVALNGIMTFTKVEAQLAAAKACPLDRLLLETDCPYLSPVPKRGGRNEPANVRLVAEFLAQLRGESFDELMAATTENAQRLFGLPKAS